MKKSGVLKIILILSIIIVVILIGYLIYKEYITQKEEKNVEISNKKNELSKEGNIFYGIKKEIRLENNKVKDEVVYNYNKDGIVKSMSEKLDCKDSDSCGYLELYDFGLFNYKYDIKNDKLKKMTQSYVYSYNNYIIYYDELANINYKNPAYSFGSYDPIEEDDEKVTYEYKDDKIISRTTIRKEDNKAIVKTTYDYDNNKLMSEKRIYEYNSYYEKKYEYDENGNVKKCTINYSFKPEDNIIVSSDTYAGEDSYDGIVYLTYNNDYDNNSLVKVTLEVNLNNVYSERYMTTYKYDKNNNLIEEIVEFDNNKYTRKIEYIELRYPEEKYNYYKKINKVQTNSYFINDGYLIDDNWLQMLYYYM